MTILVELFSPEYKMMQDNRIMVRGGGLNELDTSFFSFVFFSFFFFSFFFFHFEKHSSKFQRQLLRTCSIATDEGDL